MTVARALPCGRREDAQEFLDVRTETYRFVAGRLANELSPGSRVLDFGCSFGGLLGELEARGLAGLGVDVNPECVSFVADNGLSVVESGSLQEIAGVGEFDAVCLLDIVMYLPSEITELKEVRRLLRPDGILIIRTTNKRWLATAAHVLRRFHGPTSDDLFRRAVRSHSISQSPRSLCRLLRLLGFGDIQVETDVHLMDEVDSAARVAYRAGRVTSSIMGHPTVSPGVLIHARSPV